MAWRHAVLLSLLAVVPGCVSVPQQTAGMKQAGVEHITAQQLREMVMQYATGFAQAVEGLADSLEATSADPETRYRVLLWKSVSIANMRQAALLSDPLLGLIDVWLYTRQVRDFLADPPPEYDPHSPEARSAGVALLDQLERQARALAVRVVGEERVATFEPRLVRFAAEHPIDPRNLNRTSVMAADSAMLRPVGGGIGGALGATYWSMRDVADRAGAISDVLGKELRWNVQLIAYDLARLPVVDSTLTGVRLSLDRIGALADTLPTLVSDERAMVLEALHTELVVLTKSIDAMRRETLDAVSAERLAVLEALVRERIVLLEAVTQERVATLAALDSIVTRAIDHSESLVDHIFWRLIQLVALVLILIVVAVAIVMRVRRPAEP